MATSDQTAPSGPKAPSGAAPASKRKPGPSMWDMLRSVAIIMVPLALIYWIFSSDIGDHPVEPVNQEPVLRQAVEEAPYQVLAPQGLPPEAWIPNRAHWLGEGDATVNGGTSGGNELELGYFSPDEIYYGVRQTDASRVNTISDLSRGGQQQGTVNIDGLEWERWRSPDGRTGVLAAGTADGSTITVTADADFAELSEFARTLKPVA